MTLDTGDASPAVIAKLYEMIQINPELAKACNQITRYKSAIADENGSLTFIHNGVALTNSAAIIILSSGKVLNLIGLNSCREIQTVWHYTPDDIHVFMIEPPNTVLEYNMFS